MSKLNNEISAGSDVRYIKTRELTELEGTFNRIIDGKYGPSYELELADGEIVVVNGSGSLNKKMQQVASGQAVRIVNNGLKTLPSDSSKNFYDIAVFTA